MNAADFFTACRTFVCVCAKPLREILGEETNARKKQKTEKTTTTTTTKERRSYSPSALQLDADDSEDLEIAEMKRLEQFLGMDNLRASFAFSKVIATKFEQFCKTHFRVDELLGRAYCRFAWNAFSLTKVKLGTSLFEDAENDDDYGEETKEKPTLMLSSRHTKRKRAYTEGGKKRRTTRTKEMRILIPPQEEYQICMNSFISSSRLKRSR